MTDVVILGIGQTPVGEHWELSLRELAAKAIKEAIKQSGDLKPNALYIGNMLASILSRQSNLGAMITEYTGLTGIEATTAEAAGASGGAALRLGYLAVLSENVNVALVLGVEKYTDVIGSEQEAAITTGMDSDYEAIQGLTPYAQAALLMRQYLNRFGAPRLAFADFAITAHANAAGNPNAMYRKAITRELYENAEIVHDPLNLFDIAPYADGAAALILTRSDLVPRDWPYPLIKISASSVAGDTLALHDRPDPLDLTAARLSTDLAYRQSNLTPEQIDLFELDDSTSIYAALSLEAAGFAKQGMGWQLAANGATNKKLPISTLGGLKARGNPIGATGVYQAVEAVMQLRGQAGSNQIANAKRGMVQCWGGPAATVTTHIFERLD